MRWCHGLALALTVSGCSRDAAQEVPATAARRAEVRAAPDTVARPAAVPSASLAAAPAVPSTTGDLPPAEVPRPARDRMGSGGEAPTADPHVAPEPRPKGGPAVALGALGGGRGESHDIPTSGAGAGAGLGGSVESKRGFGRPAEDAEYAARNAHADRLPGLRAGTTDDNADFNAYLSFLAAWSDGNTPRGYRHVDVRERSYVHVVDAAGRPIPQATVRMRDPSGGDETWRARTLGDGRAAYYPRIAKRMGSPALVEVEHQGLRTEGVLIPGQDLTLTLSADVVTPAEVPLDVLFLIDTTGSMEDEIARIRATLLATTAKVRGLERKVDLRYGAVLYRDKGDDYVTRDLPFVGDVRSFQSSIMQVHTGGGGDTPEHLNAGLAAAVRLKSWRPGAAKLVFLIADAPPHLDYADDVHYADSLRVAGEKGIRIHSVAASGLDPFGSLVFRQIAQFTRGKFIFIEYGGNIAASAAAHGVTGQVQSNNLDDILLREIKSEVVGFGI